MSLSRRIKRALRGDVSLNAVALEVLRLKRKRLQLRRERAKIDEINNSPARLCSEFSHLKNSDLLSHFRQRKTPSLWKNGFDELTQIAKLQSEIFPKETERLIENATRIVKEKRWSLLGFGEFDFDSKDSWRRDPISGNVHSLDYHQDIKLSQNDGSDVRVLWELNRFGHALTLARAHSIIRDETFAEDFFSQLKSWREQNPYGRGVNWACAMEVALRAMNLLTAFEIFRRSPSLNEEFLSEILKLFDQHGRFIFDNNEFSYISTSNHYLSDVVGLLWLGILLPELQHAEEWREFGLREMLSEMDKQVLTDGADYEASTGYHRFVTELFLYSFMLCKNNGVEIPQRYRNKLRAMLDYIRAFLRPDGFAPLIGDADGGQVLPFVKRRADDHAYLLAIGAVVFNEPNFKDTSQPAPEEVLWLTGEDGLKTYESLEPQNNQTSVSFPNAGAYIMRDGDLYLYFNANDCGLNGRGSHGHNDALSIEVSAFGLPFIIDPGSYVYNSDKVARHLFRSTAYHSTVQVDNEEQNTTDINTPFVIGNEARPKVLSWETTLERDYVSAEHYGYTRLKNPVTHCRSVEFNKKEGYWLIADELTGEGKHDCIFRFHLAPNLSVSEADDGMITISDETNRNLIIRPFGLNVRPEIKQVWVSRNYGERESSFSICWKLNANLPLSIYFALIPMLTGEDERVKGDGVMEFKIQK
jgi:hypothetical protein